MQSCKQCTFPLITTMALWQLMHLGNCEKPGVGTITGRAHCLYDCIHIKSQT